MRLFLIMNLKSSFLYSALFLCLLASRASAQHQTFPLLDKYLVNSELIPSPNFGVINAIVRDDRGFFWFATSKGLCRYDGYQMRIVPVGSHRDDLPPTIITMISLDTSSLLLVTKNGLITYNLRAEQSSPFLPDIDFSDSKITSVVRDSPDVVWIGTGKKGLFGYDRINRTVRHFTVHNGLSDNRITTLCPDHLGRLWIGTVSGGLDLLEPATGRIHTFRSNPSDQHSLWSDHIFTLCEMENGDVWIGTDAGLNVLAGGSDPVQRLHIQSYMKSPVRAVARDKTGRVWIGASDIGLLSYFDHTFTRLAIPGSIAHALNAIGTLYPYQADSSGSSLLLWVGTRSGVVRVSILKNPFTNHIRDRHDLPLNLGAVLSMCRAHDSTLWLGLWGGGLERLRMIHGSYRRTGHFERMPHNPASLPDNNVETILEDRDGAVWIGTPSGLALLDPRTNTIRVARHRDGDSMSIISNDIGNIHEDHSGTVWIGTKAGLSRVIRENPLRFRNYRVAPPGSSGEWGNMVSDLLEDRFSRLWVTTYGNGINRLGDDGSFTRILNPEDTTGNRENWIYTIIEDPRGLFWLSTQAGLVSFDPSSGAFQHYQIDQLHDAHIFGITMDRNNNLWLSTGIGLARFDPRNRSFLPYDESHGMPFRELTSGFLTAHDGKLTVGGLDGFSEFYPDSISVSAHPPALAITSFSVFGKEVPAATTAPGTITLAYDQNFFSFSFAALDYTNPLHNRFAYKMIGVDHDWIDAGTRNYASYTNLDPGHYTFLVKGCNSDNVWNEEGTSIAITIVPPYWRTWWFRLLMITLVLATVYSAYRVRLRRILEVERLRLRIADDLHDDVGSNLSTIAMVSRSVQHVPDIPPAIRHKLAEIYDIAVTTSEGMKDIVWFIKPRNDTLDNLLLRMKDTASSLLRDLEHRFYAPDNLGDVRISLDVKRSFYLGFKEILTNIVKHAGADRIEIHIRHDNGTLSMIVSDNGRGFVFPSPPGPAGRGNGLESLRTRAEKLGGACEITSRPDLGTIVKFSGKV